MNYVLQCLPFVLGILGAAMVIVPLLSMRRPKFRVGQSLYLVPLSGEHQIITIVRVGEPWLWCDDGGLVDRRTMRHNSGGRCYLSADDYRRRLASLAEPPAGAA